jgi:GAF domain-containing protein
MAALNDADRLLTLRATGLLDTPPEENFDRLTRLASRILRVPVSLISLVDADRQFFKSQVGMTAPFDTIRQTPLTHSFCQHVVTSEDVLLVRNAHADPRVRANLAVRDLNVIAYVGVPLRMPDGSVLGSLCAIDGEDRDWTPEDVSALCDLAEIAMDEIMLRFEMAKNRESELKRKHETEPGRFVDAAQAILDMSDRLASDLTRLRGELVTLLARFRGQRDSDHRPLDK